MGRTAVRSALAALGFASLLLDPASATGQSPAGRPDFEHVHALALDAAGRTLWLGAHSGLYRSEDRGRTWAKVPLPASAHGPDVMTITAHPVDPDVLFVGTHEAGVLKTTSGGKSWSSLNAGLRGADVHGLAVDPNQPDKLHALVRDTGGGLYRSTDGGQRWVRIDDGPAGETRTLASVNISTGMGGIFLYAGTGEGLQRSADCF